MSKIQKSRDEIIVKALAYRNALVVRRYATGVGLATTDAENHWEELMKFLSLCATSDEVYCPSKHLDMIWHEFLLQTREYADFCAKVLGVFVHHEPTDDSEPMRYSETLRAMTEQFGSLSEYLWPPVGGGGARCHGQNCRACKSSRHEIP